MAAKKSQPATKQLAKTSRNQNQSTQIPIAVAPGQHYQMIAEAAYYEAEKRNFEGGDAGEDWLAAEAKIGELLRHA